ncbi:TonB-dependent receptor [Sphingomonas panacisoli]|uniref:TonB-dependent receptor n=1 Tax=Sphingomonas panacisoli TaxID=1813879 RepID=A0A5B8LK30_9SPHN|nr:TonB-dependent receptor [Sphingomonas panacisoli]QDZ08259.1 TonB-dependent receptor [Sphingomonas panacisoli]
MTRSIKLALAASTALGALALATPSFAQDAPAAPQDQASNVPGLDQAQTADDQPQVPEKDIVIVGSQIKGASTTAALPVTVVGRDQIDAAGAASGDELLRSIPQAGDVTFNESNNPQTSNAARGDVSSINLRNLGLGNTLVLLNGRRLVQHPTSQAGEGNVPVLSFNANALPVAGLDRVEILRDGAAAIYGSDAVAGVVNTVTKTDLNGGSLDFRFGFPSSTSRRDYEVTGTFGKNFAEGRGNISFYADYTRRTAQLAEDQPYTATDNLVPLFADNPAFAGNLTADGRATQSPWANLAVVGGPGTIRRTPGNQALTSSAGAFHTQSILNPGCLVTINADTCLGSGTRATATTLRNERFDTRPGTTVTPAINRYNTFLSAHYDVTDRLTLYTELGYYRADTTRIQPPTINLNAITIPASNYWNPFGPVTFANGQANPNRIPGLTNVPAAGLPVTLSTYRFLDAGYQLVKTVNWQDRFLVGAKGKIGGFDFDSAILYSEAQAIDNSPAIDMTKLQANLALSTPDAYNPFSGGCSATPSLGDCSPASAATINSFAVTLRRQSKTTLGLADFKLSKADLLKLPGGNLGIALGVEGRRETQYDNRDPNLDGTVTFRDSVTGTTNNSNIASVSPTFDTRGKRTVFSAFGELAVPIVSPDMNVPLIRRLDVQLAGRYEHYSDFGSVAKPKVAAAWDLVDGIRLRGSWSQGFRAPNLEQLNAVAFSRLNTNTAANTDYYRCEADVRAGRLAANNFPGCTRTIGYSIAVSGNPDLKPEKSTNWTAGIVLEPKFIPRKYGKLTITADYWSIKQTGIVGQFGPQNALVLDYLLRLQGSSNPNVVRAAVTSDDQLVFNGSGLPAAGAVTLIKDQFVNLLPQTVRGYDLSLIYTVRTDIGRFNLNVNVARLTKYARQVSPAVQALFDARGAGTINAATPLTDASSLLQVNGKPKWRWSGSLTWSLGGFTLGGYATYIGTVYDTAFLDGNGNPFVVQGQTQFNLYAQYRVKKGALEGLSMRVGARNIFDKQPPIIDSGYLGSLYVPYGRYWYTQIGFKF